MHDSEYSERFGRADDENSVRQNVYSQTEHLNRNCMVCCLVIYRYIL